MNERGFQMSRADVVIDVIENSMVSHCMGFVEYLVLLLILLLSKCFGIFSIVEGVKNGEK